MTSTKKKAPLEHLNVEPVTPDRVVVMGASGFVGGAIVRALRAINADILAISRAEVDLQSVGAAEHLASLLRPEDAFVAASAIAPCRDTGMLKDNIALVETLTDALRRQPVSHVLNISSDAIYADSLEPLTETSCAQPGSLHGIMHLTRELVLGEAVGETPCASLRPTLIYGADDPHNGYGPNRFRRLNAAGDDIVLFGEGEERRDHVYVEDVANLAVRILQHRSRGALNAATGMVISFREAAELVSALFPEPSTITGSPRSGPMPHGGYRPFDPSATTRAFPDFRYTPPAEGFIAVHAAALEVT